FFFSSRRRHTSFSRDWSSDVCSSDLHPLPLSRVQHAARRAGLRPCAAAAGAVGIGMAEGNNHGGQEQPRQWSEEQLKRRRQRSVALALVLGALVTLFFIVTIAKLGGNVAKRPVVGAVLGMEQVV